MPFYPGIRDELKKKTSEMNIPDRISESLETFFLGALKILKFLDTDSGSGVFLTLYPGSRMDKFRSGINIPDPQHW
jgi:hypothetical protein